MANTPMGLLVAGFNFSSAPEDEFNDWYDTEHVPERARTPGVHQLRALDRRRRPEDLDRHLRPGDARRPADAGLSRDRGREPVAVVEARHRQVRAHLPLRDRADAARQPGRPGIGANAMLFFAMNSAPEVEKDFNDWYNQEHVPALAAVPGCLAARRFRISKGASEGNQRYLALYHLASTEVQVSAAWKKAVETPWTERIRPNMRDRLRIVLKRYARAS